MNEGYTYSGTSASSTTYSNEENPYSWIRYQGYQFYNRYLSYGIDPFFEESKSDTLKNNTKLLKIL